MASRRVRGRTAVAVVVAMVLAGCDGGPDGAIGPSEGPSPTGEELPVEEDTIRADLHGSVADVDGLAWPDDDGELRETTGVEFPHEVVLDVGEDEPFTTASQLTFLEQRGGELVSVTVQPPEDLLPLAAAIDGVADQLERHGWLDEEVAAELEGWRATEAEEDDTFAPAPLSMRIGRDAFDVMVRLTPQADGWFWTLDLARPPDTWPQD